MIRSHSPPQLYVLSTEVYIYRLSDCLKIENDTNECFCKIMEIKPETETHVQRTETHKTVNWDESEGNMNDVQHRG